MGSLHAQEFADQAKQGNISQDAALSCHLFSNHYPPLPSGTLALAKKVLRYANRGEYNKLIDISTIGTYRGAKTAPVSACIRAWHLDAFITAQTEE